MVSRLTYWDQPRVNCFSNSTDSVCGIRNPSVVKRLDAVGLWLGIDGESFRFGRVGLESGLGI